MNLPPPWPSVHNYYRPIPNHLGKIKHTSIKFCEVLYKTMNRYSWALSKTIFRFIGSRFSQWHAGTIANHLESHVPIDNRGKPRLLRFSRPDVDPLTSRTSEAEIGSCNGKSRGERRLPTLSHSAKAAIRHFLAFRGLLLFAPFIHELKFEPRVVKLHNCSEQSKSLPESGRRHRQKRRNQSLLCCLLGFFPHARLSPRLSVICSFQADLRGRDKTKSIPKSNSSMYCSDGSIVF